MNDGSSSNGKRVVGPVLVDDRLDLGFHVGAHLLDDRLFLGGQDVRELVEVTIRCGQLLELPEMASLLLMRLLLMSLLSPFFVSLSLQLPNFLVHHIVVVGFAWSSVSEWAAVATPRCTPQHFVHCVPVRSPNDFVQSRCLDHHPNGVVPVSGRGIVRGT